MKRRQPTILSVDDSAEDASLLRAALQEGKLGCELKTAASVDEAIAYLQGQGAHRDRASSPFPDLVLLDIQMPGKDGFALLSWIRSQAADWRRVPVVMLTTGHNYEEIRRAYDLGANSFLVKPADFDELSKMLGQLAGYWLSYNKTFLPAGQ